MTEPVEKAEKRPGAETPGKLNAGTVLAQGDSMPYNAYTKNTAAGYMPVCVIGGADGSKTCTSDDPATGMHKEQTVDGQGREIHSRAYGPGVDSESITKYDPSGDAHTTTRSQLGGGTDTTRDTTNNGQNWKETKTVGGYWAGTTVHEKTPDGYKETKTELGNLTTTTEHHDTSNGWTEHTVRNSDMGPKTTDRKYDKSTGRTTEDTTDDSHFGNQTHRVTESNGSYHETYSDKTSGNITTTDYDAGTGKTHSVLREPDGKGGMRIRQVTDTDEKTGESTNYSLGFADPRLNPYGSLQVTVDHKHGGQTVSFADPRDITFDPVTGRVNDNGKRIVDANGRPVTDSWGADRNHWRETELPHS